MHVALIARWIEKNIVQDWPIEIGVPLFSPFLQNHWFIEGTVRFHGRNAELSYDHKVEARTSFDQ